MRLSRGILRAGVAPLSLAGAGVLAALAATWRWDIRDEERIRAMEARIGAGGGIFALWHNRLAYAFLCPRWRHRNFATIVSHSPDGELIARIARRFGYVLPRGSSSAGGAAALAAMTSLIRDGRLVGFTPDGPRGPRYVAHPGAVVLAQRTGVPIIPIAAAADRRWRARSWDRFEIAAPFARVAVVAGPFVEVGRTERVEEARRRLEGALREATARADGIFGRGRIERMSLLHSAALVGAAPFYLPRLARGRYRASLRARLGLDGAAGLARRTGRAPTSTPARSARSAPPRRSSPRGGRPGRTSRRSSRRRPRPARPPPGRGSPTSPSATSRSTSDGASGAASGPSTFASSFSSRRRSGRTSSSSPRRAARRSPLRRAGSPTEPGRGTASPRRSSAPRSAASPWSWRRPTSTPNGSRTSVRRASR